MSRLEPMVRRRPGAHARTAASVALALAALAALGWIAWAWVHAGGGLDEIARRWGLCAALVLVPLQTAVSLSFSPVPSDAVAFVTSLVYGFWLGAFFAWLAWMAGALLQYAAVRRAARRIDVEALRASLPGWLRRIPPDHPAFLICARWLPLGPHVVNTAAAALGVPLGRFVWCAAVANAPVAAIVAAVAAGVAGV